MGLLDFLRRRSPRTRGGGGTPVLDGLRARLPRDGAPGLLPPPDPADAEAERRIAERFAAELHAWGPQAPAGLSRRAAAIADAVGRRRVDELAEALEDLPPWELPSLLEALDARADLDRAGAASLARTLAAGAERRELLAAGLALLALAPAPADRELLALACRSPAYAGVCAMSAEPLGPDALLHLARASEGLGRALVLERLGLACADRPADIEPLAPEALRLAETLDDPVVRAWAAIPLLEVPDVPALLAREPALATAVAACLEAAARGGWNGGPGPGLGRMPGAIRAAEALLAGEAPEEARRRAARAVLDAHPLPPGPVRRAAEAVAAGA